MNHMIDNSLPQCPSYAPIDLDFDKLKLFYEIKQSGILRNKTLVTPHAVNGRSAWDNGGNFKSKEFEKHAEVPLWIMESGTSVLKKKHINTFYGVNITTPYSNQNVLDNMWIGDYSDKDKMKPLWIVKDHPWQYRTDVDLPYLKSIVDQLSLEYVSAIRMVYQTPPSIGVIHRDSGPKLNAEYYKNGGVSITLNVASGGANLYFIDNQGNERTIDESNISVWHFDDAKIHCTNEINSERMQLRIYGKHRSYTDLMILDKRVD